MSEPIKLSLRERPSLVTWLAVAVFIMACANIMAVIYGIWRWQVVSTLNLSAPLVLLIVLRGVWGVVWLVIAVALFTLRSWARRAAPLAFIIYEITIIGQQVLLSQSAYTHIRLPFSLLLAALGFALILWIITRPRVVGSFESP
jgi:hypothetical protein